MCVLDTSKWWRVWRPGTVRGTCVRGHGHATISQSGRPGGYRWRWRRFRRRPGRRWLWWRVLVEGPDKANGDQAWTLDGPFGSSVGAIRTPERRSAVRKRQRAGQLHRLLAAHVIGMCIKIKLFSIHNRPVKNNKTDRIPEIFFFRYLNLNKFSILNRYKNYFFLKITYYQRTLILYL